MVVVDVFARRGRLIATVSALGLGLSVAGQASGAPGNGGEGDRKARVALEILERPAERFERSIETHEKLLRERGETVGLTSPEKLGVSQATLDAIAACESGGDPTAIGGGGAYRGKYQFDTGTWASVGGSGDPAAAPETEQDMRAAMLYARAGSSPWPICGV
jgi:soluble lytic murein transglycosylase-like protein